MNHYPQNFQPLDHQQKPLPYFFQLNKTHQNDNVSDNSSNSMTTIDNPNEATTTSSSNEPMFEKPLTPSDVGKLNRLVIPKQHAEKYFPLAGSGEITGGVTGSGGLLLGFEDETGKGWRFRYSYWNSSQSYVLTKGWSRFVKEKKLDAGDIVLFERHRVEPDRFFIGWRKRRSGYPVRTGDEFTGWGQRSSAVQVLHGYPAPQIQRIAASFHYRPSDCFHAGTSQKGGRPRSVNSKRVRLFGVNLECQIEENDITEPHASGGSTLSSHSPTLVQGFGSGLGLSSGSTDYNCFDYMGYPHNHHYHMDIKFPQDVNHVRNRPG